MTEQELEKIRSESMKSLVSDDILRRTLPEAFVGFEAWRFDPNDFNKKGFPFRVCDKEDYPPIGLFQRCLIVHQEYRCEILPIPRGGSMLIFRWDDIDTPF